MATSLFSLQPSQRRGLSAFKPYGADLEHAGSMQNFIDPSLTGGEGLSLTPSEEPLDPSTIGRTDEGGFYSTVTGTQFGGGQAPETEGAGGARTSQTGPKGPGEDQQKGIDFGALAGGAAGAVKKGVTAFEALRDLFGSKQGMEGAPGETKFDFDTPELDWNNSEAVSQWLASNPEASHSLFGQEIGKTPADISQWLTQEGNFDLGDTRLDANFLNSFEGADPTTGTFSPAQHRAAGTVGSAIGGGLGLAGQLTGIKALGPAGAAVSAVSNFAANPTNPANIGAALGLFASLTGDKGLAQLAGAVGGVIQLGQLVGPVAAAAASGSAVAMQAAMTALSAAAPAAVVAAVIQMGMAIANGIEAGNPPEQIVLDTLAAPDLIASNIMTHVIDPMFHKSEEYMTFPERVGETGQAQQQQLQILGQELPRAKTKEDLDWLLRNFEVRLQHHIGGYGLQNTPQGLLLSPLPEAGARTHGMKSTPYNYNPVVDSINRVLPQLYASLPSGGPGQGALQQEWGQYVQEHDRAAAEQQRLRDEQAYLYEQATQGTA